MMKKCSVFVGFALLLHSVPAVASTPTVNQHYMQPVLTRIDDGLNRASMGVPVNNFIHVFLSWLSELETAIVGSIDTETRIVLQAEELIKMTPCLHYDILVLEAKIEEINEAMKAALREKRVMDIWLLKDLLKYANTRYNHLVMGATDPGYEDEDFHDWRSFDPLGWCCLEPVSTTSCMEVDRTSCNDHGGILFGNLDECAQVCKRPDPSPNPPPPVCPFDSNYLPPTASGFGCHVEAMEAVQGINSPSFPVEHHGLSEFEAKVEDFYTQHKDELDTADTIMELVQRPPQQSLPLRIDTTRNHKRVFSCTEAINNVLGTITALPEGAARVELRGPFTMKKDEISIVRLVEGLLRERGAERNQEISLMLPSEFPEGSAARADAEAREAKLPGFVRWIRERLRVDYKRGNASQAAVEALPIVQSVDVQQRVSEEFSILREPMIQLIDSVSTQSEGTRGFAENYAKYLRRSCLFRPCNGLLDSVIDIVENDKCFPYANGEFKEDGYSFADCS